MQQSDGVVERHRLDVERAEDRFLVDQVAVVGDRVTRRQDDTHVAQIDVHRAQVGAVQRRTLPRTAAIPARDGHGSIFLHPTQPNPPITHLREMQTPVL